MSPFVRCGTIEVSAEALPLLASAGLSQFRRIARHDVKLAVRRRRRGEKP